MNILDLLRHYGIEPKRVAGTKGGEYHSPCPGCGGEDRFHVWPEQNNGEGSWWCRGCDEGGDCIDFLRGFNGLSFREAAEQMGREVKGPSRHTVRTPQNFRKAFSDASLVEVKKVQDPEEVWRYKAESLVNWAQAELLKNKDWLLWLKQRGITEKSVHRFRLGRVSKDVFRPRSSWGLPEIYKEDGKAKKLWVPQGICIPKFDYKGRVQRVRIRRDEGEPRYFVLPGCATDPAPLYYIPSTWPGHEALIVCESELDGVLISQEAGDLVSVLGLGNASSKPKDEIASAVCERAAWIGVALDKDEAGDKYTSWWLEAYKQSKDIRTGLKDPGEMAEQGRSIREWLLGFLPPAWKIGHKIPGKQEEGEGGEQDNKTSTNKIRISKPVQALKRLIDQIDVRVVMVCGAESIGLYAVRYKQGSWVPDYHWFYSDEGKQIHDLFWYNQEVGDYLFAHPKREQGIHYKNFWDAIRE